MAANIPAVPTYPPTTPGLLVIPPVNEQSAMTKQLLNLPPIQPIRYRRPQTPPIYDKDWKFRAALLQQRGVANTGHAECVHCRLFQVGPFADCVVMPNSDWGCGNREFSKERTNSQYGVINKGYISSRMLIRGLSVPNQAIMLAEAQNRVHSSGQAFNTWLAAHRQSITARSLDVPAALSAEAIRRVILETAIPNMLEQPTVPDLNVEITEGFVDQFNNSLTKASVMAATLMGTTPSATKDQKYAAAAEAPAPNLFTVLQQERNDTLVITTHNPGYIFMSDHDQVSVRTEIRDMIDRRFTAAVARVMGVNYPIVSFTSPTQTKTAIYLRIPGTGHFSFPRPAGMSLKVWNRNQRANIVPFV